MKRDPFGEDTQAARALHRWCSSVRLRMHVLREQVHPVLAICGRPAYRLITEARTAQTILAQRQF